jgi:hypothetical protein
MADASERKVGNDAARATPPSRVLTPDEELRLLHAHAELSGDLAAAARLQTAYDPLEQTQENPELPAMLRSQDALAASPRRGAAARLRRLRRVAALVLLTGGAALLAVALLSGPG